MKTFLLIWPLVIGHCLAGPFFFGQQGAVANASSAWSPPTTSNLALWLDAQLETSYADAASVQTPTDWSGSGNAPTQSTSAARPTLETGEINGNAVFRFDGVDDRWIFSGSGLDLLKNTGAATVYWVSSTSSVAAARSVWGWSSGTSTTANRLFGGIAASGFMRAGGRRLDADALSDNSGATAVSTGTFYVFSLVVDYTNSNIYGYINGTNQISNTSFQTDGNTSNTSSQGAAVGSGSAASTVFYLGDTACVLFYAGVAHDSTTRQSIESSLRTRFGL